MLIAKRLVATCLLLIAFIALQPTLSANAGGGASSGSPAERAASIIAAGNGFNCWVQSGAVRCIGGNASGQLGDSTTTSRTSAVGVTGLSTGVISIAVGDAHACALTSAGAVKCWGSNTKGQLGDGTTVNSLVPVQVNGLTTDVARIDADGDNTCALKTSGQLLCWGSNQTFGVGVVSADVNADGEFDPLLVPTEVTGMSSGVVGVSLGAVRTSATVYASHGCAVMQTGEVKCWGSNTSGELGSSVASPTAVPVSVDLGANAVGLALGESHSCALTTAGGVKCWGVNTYGQLGGGNTNAVAAGTTVDVTGFISGVEQISAGRNTTCLVTSAGALNCWGYSAFEVIRRTPGVSSVSTPEITHSLSSGISAVSVGSQHACALKATGELACWGSNDNGQAGDGYSVKILTPQSVQTSTSDTTPLAGFQSIGATMWSTCGVHTNGTLKCWGHNGYGTLGDGTNFNQPTPVTHAGFSGGVVSVSQSGAISSHGHCAILTDTSVKCWGSNTSGKRGFNVTNVADYSLQAPLASVGPDVPLTGVTSVSNAATNMCWVASGAVKCAGGSTAGSLGNGFGPASAIPVQVSGITSGAVAVASTGGYASCAVINDGTVKCWGNGQQYQLGNASAANASTPVQVSNLTDAAAITAGDYFSCVLTTTGAVKCWGNNNYGQLGNGTTATPTTPVTVTGITGATKVVAGTRSGCAIMANQTLKCWGWNYWGIFGDGTTTDSSTPVAVPGLTGVTDIALGGTHICALLSDTTVKCWGSEQSGQLGNNVMSNRWFDGSTYVATGLSVPQALPMVTTTTTTTSTTTTTTSTTIAPTTAATTPVSGTNTPVNRIDNTVYKIAPAMVGSVSAFSILTRNDSRKLRISSQTPAHCVAAGIRVYTLDPGECRVIVRSLATGKVLRVWRSTVVKAVLSIGSTVRIAKLSHYARLSDSLPDKEFESLVKPLRNSEAALIVGHTAIFTGNNIGNMNLSEQRAEKLKDYLLNRGVEGEILSVGVGARVPLHTTLIEKKQASNRRVMVYYIPKLTKSK